MKNGYHIELWNGHNKCHVFYKDNYPIYVDSPDHYEELKWRVYVNKNKEMHREDGPAIVYDKNYEKYYDDEWYLNGESINVRSQKEFEKYLLTLAFR